MTKVLFVLIISICANITAQVIHTSGKYILGPCNDTLILKGVNYAPYNYGYSPNQLNLNQIGLSKANCVRMPWYLNAGTTPNVVYTNLVKLDSALSKCIQQKMIAIVDLHDQTCQNNPSNVSTLAQWWVQPAILTLINKYKHSFILNIVNEALYVDWASSPTTALTTFTQTYAGIISNLRTNGIPFHY